MATKRLLCESDHMLSARAMAAAALEEAPGFADVAAAVDAGTPPAVRAIVLAGLVCFADRGYVATTTRDVAARAGLSPAGMYAHFASKAELLATVVEITNRAVIDRLRAADDAEGPARERLRMTIATLTSLLAVNHAAGRVANYEYRHLPDHLRAPIDRQRKAIFDHVAAAITAGARDGSLHVGDPATVARAVLSMCVDVCRWFGDDHTSDPEALGTAYGALALDLCRATG